ncbi:MAG TPA: hypothetical protein VFM19_07190, partial [Candidatus Limnocylindria bacterium]|nr:hypothetical protein [Candidatus Limnocylindria bacterium]
MSSYEAITALEPALPRESIYEKLGARTLDKISTAPPAPLLLDRLDPTDTTLLYGKGSIGKGTLSDYWMGRLEREHGMRIAILDYENHPEEWARRYFGLFGQVSSNILHVAPTGHDWKGTSGPIWEQVEDLGTLLTEFRADYLLIDSVVFACGNQDALKAETPAQYNSALTKLGLPSLSIAHVVKDSNLEYPFGSVFWHNGARLTWSLGRENGKVLLVNRKANNYATTPKHVIDITWLDGLPREVREEGYVTV